MCEKGEEEGPLPLPLYLAGIGLCQMGYDDLEGGRCLHLVPAEKRSPDLHMPLCPQSATL